MRLFRHFKGSRTWQECALGSCGVSSTCRGGKVCGKDAVVALTEVWAVPSSDSGMEYAHSACS